MNFKKAGIIASILFSTSLFASPILAKTQDLNISNQTSYTLSFDVNGKCSADFGAVSTYTIKHIPEENFKKACKDNNSPCQVNIHDTENCKGKLIATVSYFIPQHRVDLYSYGQHRLSIAVSGFDVFLVEPAIDPYFPPHK